MMNDKNNPLPESFQRAGLWIFLAALAVRLVYFAWSQSSPFLYYFSTDETFYIEYARNILAGKNYPYANFMDPLIAYLLVIPMYFTENMHLARLLFLLMDSANAYLVYKVTEALTSNRKAALLAGILYIFYSLTVIYSVFITKSTPIIFVLLLTTFCFLKGIHTQQKMYFFGAGLCSASLIFLGASFVLLAVFYSFLLVFNAEWRRFAIHYFSGLIILIAAYASFFYITDETKSVLPTNGGVVFYISNHAQNPWGTHNHPDFVKEATPQGIYHAFKEQAQKENPLIKTDREVSGYWYQKAAQENRDNPVNTLHRLSNKLKLLISNDEISQNYYFPYIKEHTLKNLPLITFAFIFGLGISGLIFFAPIEKNSLLILGPVFVVITTCMIFFVSARMRMPLVPFLIIGCSYWVCWFGVPLGKRLLAMGFAILLIGMSYSMTYNREDTAPLEDQYNLAVVMVNAEMLTEADQLMDVLLAQQKIPKFLFLKAVILSKQGRCEEALPLYDEVSNIMPDYQNLKSNRHICEEFLKQQ